ncbi:MAG: helix-turn-helix domain-containing protein [Treponema sp.]|nr:helix-turn-helix domain-containing protein [Treponema sp.]
MMADSEKGREYGKFLKHLRIEKEEMLRDMAHRLGLNSSYLSAIESGTRDIPAGLTDKICSLYGLSEGEGQKLKNAELDAERKVLQINMEEINKNRLAKEVVLNFAGKAASLTEEQLLKINEVLNGTV